MTPSRFLVNARVLADLGCPPPRGDAAPAPMDTKRSQQPWTAPRKENLKAPKEIFIGWDQRRSGSDLELPTRHDII